MLIEQLGMLRITARSYGRIRRIGKLARRVHLVENNPLREKAHHIGHELIMPLPHCLPAQRIQKDIQHHFTPLRCMPQHHRPTKHKRLSTLDTCVVRETEKLIAELPQIYPLPYPARLGKVNWL